LQSVTGRQGVAYRHNIAGLISEDSEEVATQIATNCRRRQPHLHLTLPPRGTPANIPMAYTLYFQKLESLAYIFVVDSISSFKSVQWALKDASFLQQSAFWPFKVIQGRVYSMDLAPD